MLSSLDCLPRSQHSAAMTENIYIKKRQKARAKPLLTLRIIFGLIFLSAVVWAGFYFEYGSLAEGDCEGDCESLYSLTSWVIGFFMIFSAIIAAGTLVGGLFAILRWSRRRQAGTLASLIPENEQNHSDK